MASDIQPDLAKLRRLVEVRQRTGLGLQQQAVVGMLEVREARVRHQHPRRALTEARQPGQVVAIVEHIGHDNQVDMASDVEIIHGECQFNPVEIGVQFRRLQGQWVDDRTYIF